MAVALKRRVWARDRLYCLSSSSGARVRNSFTARLSSWSAQRALSSSAGTKDSFLAALSRTFSRPSLPVTNPLDSSKTALLAAMGSMADSVSITHLLSRIWASPRIRRKLISSMPSNSWMSSPYVLPTFPSNTPITERAISRLS